MIDVNKPLTIASGYRLQYEEAQGCYVLLYPEGMVKLNQAAGIVMSLVDGEKSTNDIIQTISEHVQDEGLAEDVGSFVETASANGWLSFSSEK